jgi:outer membrane lipoprotein SlyB
MRHIVKQSITRMMALLLVGSTFATFAQRPYRVNDRQVEQLITRIETRTDSFRSISNTALKRSRINDTSRESELNNYINEFERATDQLKDRFRSRQSVSADVSNVMIQAGQIDRFIRTNFRDSNAERSWSNLRSDLNTLAHYYNVNWDWNASTSPGNYSNTGYYNNQNSCLVGTYRLDAARSDNPSQVVNRAITNVDARNQDRVRGNLERRLEAPAMLTLDRNGQNITIASARAAQVTIVADGQSRTEQNAQGRSTSIVAAFNRDRLSVTTTGDRGNDYSVTFEPMDNCRRLRVTRTISNNRVSQPITAQSVYEKTSDRAQFDMSSSGNEFPNDRQRASFIIPDGTQMTAVLDTDLNTKEAQDGDYFTMTVRAPRQYDGAIIEGTILGVERSGRITGRAGLNLNFERIRLRNGQTYNFAGTLENARTVDGQTVRIDAEGSVQNEKSQTRDTVTRTGVGAALGAIIGAIAGGGKGAAIGATVGAGAGAGSVVVQGRDDLELKRGTEITLRASAPR